LAVEAFNREDVVVVGVVGERWGQTGDDRS
jgi:hypothetical protein